MNDREILKEAQRVSGMKQYELAEKLGVNKATISTGIRRERMSVSTFCKYLGAMGFTVKVCEEVGGVLVPLWELESAEGDVSE